MKSDKQAARIFGKVKWYNSEKGYGFIAIENQEQDAFVHHTGIIMQGRKILNENQRVSFELVDSEKGKKAINVKVHKDV